MRIKAPGVSAGSRKDIMSKHKPIPRKIRQELYEKYNHKCAYCGCELDYKDMQVDHVKSVYANTDISESMTVEEMYSIDNLLPACRPCNFYKGSMELEVFRSRLTTTMMDNIRKEFTYKLAVKYGLIKEFVEPVKFYFETLD